MLFGIQTVDPGTQEGKDKHKSEDSWFVFCLCYKVRELRLYLDAGENLSPHPCSAGRVYRAQASVKGKRNQVNHRKCTGGLVEPHPGRPQNPPWNPNRAKGDQDSCSTKMPPHNPCGSTSVLSAGRQMLRLRSLALNAGHSRWNDFALSSI